MRETISQKLFFLQNNFITVFNNNSMNKKITILSYFGVEFKKRINLDAFNLFICMKNFPTSQ